MREAMRHELHRLARIVRGDPHAYDDLVVELEEAWAAADELEDEGAPLPEELDA